MDLQKEREAFEKECRLLCYKGNMVMSNLGSFYNNEQTNWMWQMWLSAKAQAVPKDSVAVSKWTLALALNSIENNEDNEDIIQDLQKLIHKAQEPTND